MRKIIYENEEVYLTKNNHESKRCKVCNENQHNQDAKRMDRNRNYKKNSVNALCEQIYANLF